MLNASLLSLLIFSPVIFSAIILVFFNKNSKISFALGVLSTLFSLLLSLYATVNYDASSNAMAFVVSHDWWLEGIRYQLGVDGLSLGLILLTAAILPLCILSIKKVDKQLPIYIALLLALQTTIFGVFSATDLVLFYLFFEASLIPMYLIIGKWGGKGRIAASFKFFLYTLVGSLLMLVAIVYLYNIVGSTAFSDLRDFNFDLSVQKYLWLALFAAFAVKIPMFPFHTWLPVAHVEAPTAGSVILAAILLKMGAYGFLRLSIPMFPDASAYYADFVMILSAIAVIYASIVAFAQSDIKRLIAYSSIAHMGYVTIAIFTLTEGGLQAAIYQMISHGFVSAGLFFCIGVLYDRYHTRDMAFYGGLAKVMPSFAIIFMIFTMANVGLPGTSGFVGEFLTIMNVMPVSGLFTAIIAFAVILSAAYGLMLYKNTLLGETNMDKFGSAIDISNREKLILVPLILLTLYFGFETTSLTNFTQSAVDIILDTAR
ncbi:MAG: NADH-quinone oxidoreductase subunit M [Alphaproteobacteria bacterium]|jgi:NADH-quinone oxidoreductase subunit M